MSKILQFYLVWAISSRHQCLATCILLLELQNGGKHLSLCLMNYRDGGPVYLVYILPVSKLLTVSCGHAYAHHTLINDLVLFA